MDIQQCLRSAAKKSPEPRFGRVSQRDGEVQAHQLCVNSGSLGTIVDVVLGVHGSITPGSAIPATCVLLRHRWARAVLRRRDFATLGPRQEVAVQSLFRLSFGTVPVRDGDTQGRALVSNQEVLLHILHAPLNKKKTLPWRLLGC